VEMEFGMSWDSFFIPFCSMYSGDSLVVLANIEIHLNQSIMTPL